MVVEVSLPDTATLDPGSKLPMLIAAPRTERRDRRLVARVVGSGSAGVSVSIEAA